MGIKDSLFFRDDWAQPVHKASFTYNFYMDSTEVTQKDFEDLMYETYNAYFTPCWTGQWGESDTHPAYSVNWYDAILYCNARSKRDGLDTVYTYRTRTQKQRDNFKLTRVEIDYSKNGYRLPTEAEWEFACRGGSKSDYYWDKEYLPYPKSAKDSAEISKHAVWVEEDTAHMKVKTQPVASKLPNGYGLYDMIGNVWEWTNTMHYNWETAGINSYNRGDKTNPTGPLFDSDGYYQITRGGSYKEHAGALRSSYRSDASKLYDGKDLGFRCVLVKEGSVTYTHIEDPKEY